MTKKEEFIIWCRRMKYVSSVQATSWGLSNGYHRADRTLREMAQLGIVERLNWSQKVSLGLMNPENTEIAWYRV